MAIQIQLRRGTADQWASANTILALAELALEIDTSLYKIGDGVTHWSDLPYGGATGPTAGEDTEIVFNRGGYANTSSYFSYDYPNETLLVGNNLIVSNTLNAANTFSANFLANTAYINSLTTDSLTVSTLDVIDNLNVANTLTVNNTLIVANTLIVNTTLDVYDTLNVNNTLNVTNTLVVSNTASIANVLTFGNNFILGANFNNGELEQIGPALVIGTDASILTNGPESTPWYAPQGGSFATEQHLFFANASLVQVGNSSSYFNLYNDSLSFYDIAGDKAGTLSVFTIDAVDISANTLSVADSITIGESTTINSISFSGTSNNTLYVGDVAAIDVVSNSQLQANLNTVYANSVYYTDTVIGLANTAITANSDAAYTNAVTFSANASNITNGTLDEERLPYRMDQDVRKEDDVEFHNITITGMIVSGNVTVIGSNNLAISDNMIYLNSNTELTNPDLGFVGNYNDGEYHHTGFFRDASDGVWKVFENYKPEPDASPFIDTANNTFRIADFHANTIHIGNVHTEATITSTNYSGTSNNTLYVGSVAAIDVVSNAQLIANLANFQLTANLTSEVFKITANNATYAFGKTQSELNVNNALTSNNASYLNNKPEDNLNVNTALTSNNAAYLGNVASSFYINTSASYTITGVHTHNANIIIGSTATVSANGSVGTQGQVLTSNGSTIYWANPYSGFSNGQSISVNNFIITGSFTANGTIGSNGQVLTSNGSTVYWSSTGGSLSAVDATSQTFTGNGSNTVFTLVTSVANQKNIIVSINGLLQVPVTHYSITGTALTFTDAPYDNTIIEVRSMEGVVISSGGGSVSSGDLFLGAMLLGGM